MLSATNLASAVLAFTLLGTATGAAVKYPDVIPGPGLPSLAELNVTSAELYQLGMPDLSSPPFSTLATKFNPRCGPANAAYTNVQDVIACYHYLDKLGHKKCVAPKDLGIAHFCYAGGAEITGQSLKSSGAASYCSDVAIAVIYTVNHCTRPDQSVAGFQAANGNGNLIVGSTSKKWVGSK